MRILLILLVPFIPVRLIRLVQILHSYCLRSIPHINISLSLISLVTSAYLYVVFTMRAYIGIDLNMHICYLVIMVDPHLYHIVRGDVSLCLIDTTRLLKVHSQIYPEWHRLIRIGWDLLGRQRSLVMVICDYWYLRTIVIVELDCDIRRDIRGLIVGVVIGVGSVVATFLFLIWWWTLIIFLLLVILLLNNLECRRTPALIFVILSKSSFLILLFLIDHLYIMCGIIFLRRLMSLLLFRIRYLHCLIVNLCHILVTLMVLLRQYR